MDPERPPVRIGGWIPPYEAAPRDAFPPESFAYEPAVPSRSAPPGTARHDRGVDVTWVLVAIGVVAVLALVIVTVADQHKAVDRRPRANLLAQAPPMELPDVPMPMLPSAGPSTTTPPASPRTSRPRAIDQGHPARPPTTRPAVATKPGDDPPSLTAGRRVSLQPAGLPGFRVRHRDFRARVDRVDAASPGSDRADATFVVRAGLAGAGCVSLESANHPGWYLRHRNSEMFLQARDGSAPFAADATFCPVAVEWGRATVLRSRDHPRRYLVQRGSMLTLERVPAGEAMPFLVRPPL
jgi:hypothetical protein